MEDELHFVFRCPALSGARLCLIVKCVEVDADFLIYPFRQGDIQFIFSNRAVYIVVLHVLPSISQVIPPSPNYN